MSAVSLRLPDSLHQPIKKLAVKDRISVNQIITLAVAEKLSTQMTADYLERRGAGASQDRFLGILAKAKDQEPDPKDRR